MFVLSFVSNCIISLLIITLLILLINLLLRPSLWTYFNISMTVYHSLNVILGSFNIHILSNIMTNHLNLSNVGGVGEIFVVWAELEKNCILFTFWFGTWAVRNIILISIKNKLVLARV